MRRIWLVALFAFALAGLASTEVFARLEIRELETRAKAYADELAKRRGTTPPQQVQEVDRLVTDAKQALLRKAWPRAIETLEAAVASDAARVQAWLDLSTAWAETGADRPQALDAAFNAYTRAKRREDRVLALRALGEIYYKRYDAARQIVDNIQKAQRTLDSNFDPDTSRVEAQRARLSKEYVAASDEALAALTNSRRVYQELGREQKGDVLAEERSKEAGPELLKPISGQIDVSDKAAAYCVNYNLNLAADAELYRRFLSVARDEPADRTAGLDPAAAPLSAPQITVNKTTLCVHGFEHGRSFVLALKQGLTSQAGLKSTTDRELRFRVPDRAPQYRVRNTAFVMPRDGEGVIPVRTVNALQLAVELVRVSDRSLARDIARGVMFKERNLGPSDALQQVDNRNTATELLWKGTVSIDRPERNKEVVTNLPVGKLIAARAGAIEAQADAARKGAGKGVGEAVTLNVDGMKGDFEPQPADFQEAVRGRSFNGFYALVIRKVEKSPPNLFEGRDTPNTSAPADVAEEKAFETKAPLQGNDWFTEPTLQWFVITDTGLTTYEGADKLYVAARSLGTAKPLAAVDIELVSHGNQVLQRARTNSQGVAELPARLARGTGANKLAAIIGSAGGDFAFINYTQDTFDMSRRGVEGREAAATFEAFVYPDRGVYRPGETVQALVLVRDAAGRAPETLPPLSLALRGKDGRAVVTRPLAGPWRAAGIVVPIALPMSAELGAGRLDVRLGQNGDRIGTAPIQVEHFRPDRARIQLDEKAWRLAASADGPATLTGAADVQFLYGFRQADGTFRDARVAGLSGDAELLLRKASSPFKGCYAGFGFGLVDEEFTPQLWRRTLDGRTDERGRLAIEARFERLPVTSRPLEGVFSLTMLDQGGVLARKTEVVTFPQVRPWLGLRVVDNASLVQGGPVTAEFLAVDGANAARAGAVSYELWRERDDFIWLQTDGLMKYRSDIARTLVERGTVNATAGAAQSNGCQSANATKSFALQPGRYALVATDASGAKSSIRFGVGFSSADVEEPTPDKLNIRVDSSTGSYAVGDQIRLSIDTPFDGEVLVAIGDNEVVQWQQATTTNRAAEVTLAVPDAWRGRAFYALATVFRPGTDAQRGLGPMRALGAVHFDIQRKERALEIQAPPGIRFDNAGDEEQTVSIEVRGAEGPTHLAAFIVDEGILNLTTHAPADPYNFFFGKRSLGLKVMDTYGRIIRAERQAGDKQGGDQMLRPIDRMTPQNYTSDRIIAVALPLTEVRDGRATVQLKTSMFANFDGTARLMIVAWSREKVGASQSPIVVRSRIVTTLAAPRFLAPGDEARMTLSLHNVASRAGRYAIEIGADGPLSIKRIEPPKGGAVRTQGAINFLEMDLADGQRAGVGLVVSAASDEAADGGRIRIALRGITENVNADVSVRREWPLQMRPARPPSAQLLSFRLAPGTQRTINQAALKDIIDNDYLAKTVKVQARVARNSTPGLPTQGLVASVAGAPVRAVERLIWQGYGLLQGDSGDADRLALERTVGDILALQKPDGTFRAVGSVAARKPPGRDAADGEEPDTGDNPDRDAHNTALALDLLKRAKAAAVNVPDEAMRRTESLLADRLQMGVADAADPKNRGSGGVPPAICTRELFLSASVLADGNVVSRSTLEDLDEACGGAGLPSLERAFLAGALRGFGDTQRADKQLVSFRADKSWQKASISQQERSMMWASLVQAGAPANVLDDVLSELSPTQGPRRMLPLSAVAWLARGNADLVKNAAAGGTSPIKVAVTPDASVTRAPNGDVATRFQAASELPPAGLKIANTGDQSVTATVTLFGVPKEARSAGGSGFQVARSMYDRNGQPLAPGAPIKQNELVYVVIDGRRILQETVLAPPTPPAAPSQPPAKGAGPVTGAPQGKAATGSGAVAKIGPTAAEKGKAATPPPSAPVPVNEPAAADSESASGDPKQLALVTDLLPAGFEIAAAADAKGTDVRGAITAALPVELLGKIVLEEGRDDRWTAIIEPSGQEGETRGRFRVAYVVRATGPGRFVQPAATVEDLVKPEIAARTATGEVSITPDDGR